MLIKLPKTGPGVRYVDSECIKTIGVTKTQETARDPFQFAVALMDDKQKLICTINCVSSDAADNLMDTIATLCNFSPDKPSMSVSRIQGTIE